MRIELWQFQCERRSMFILFICLGAMRQRQPGHFEHVAFSQKIRHFLNSFKINFCPNPYPHVLQFCNQYHSEQDRRRNPYLEQNFAYHPSELCPCKQDDCNQCHNNYQVFYHPRIYKTTKCTNYGCRMHLLCYMVHENEVNLINRYQFFRFQFQTFKTELCPHREPNSNLHELASCHFYHNDSDKRRNPRKVAYSHVQCAKHCNEPECPYAHNTIEQLYHPSRYKTKYCQSYVQRKTCSYNQYCSFAHSDHQIKIELLHEMQKTTDFQYYKYKTVWCPYTNQHDRGSCPYAHNFQDYRRDPKKKYYTPEICPHWTKGEIKSIEDSGCPLRMECPKSHGWLEKKYHPDLRTWEAGQTRSLDQDKTKKGNFGVGALGAPFFKKQEKSDKSERSRSEVKKTSSKPKEKSKLQEIFPHIILFPDKQSFEIENNQNLSVKTQFEVYWQGGKQKKNPHSPFIKSRISKKHKTQYTKSLKQLLTLAGLEEKLSQIKMNQIKLLTITSKDLQDFGLKGQEKDQLLNAIKQYSKSHKPENYSDSMVKLFRKKMGQKMLDKLRNKNVPQKVLQCLSSSSIDDLSFLEEEEKSSLPKILEQYADDRAFRELNTLIKEQTSTKVKKSRHNSFYSFKT